jgi:hypothetical protein
MKTKRDKVRIILNQAEYMDLEKAKDILEDYIKDCDKDDLVTLNEQLYQHTGVLGAVVGACDILQYICDESIVED